MIDRQPQHTRAARTGRPVPLDGDGGTPAEPDTERHRLPPAARIQLLNYVDLLAKWNRAYNLTAIRDRPRMITHHVNDALAVLPVLPAGDAVRVLDVGTGGGTPGIPLAIARPAWTCVLLDSNQKKVTFVTQAIIELGLANAEAVAARVEAYEPEAPFDVVISRAFSDLATFARAAAPRVAPGGMIVAMKGKIPHAEIDALPPEIEHVSTQALEVAGVNAERHVVLMRRRDAR